MPQQVKIISEKRVFDGFFKVDEAHLQHELYNGTMSAELTRLNFNRGDSAAVVLHDPLADGAVPLPDVYQRSRLDSGNSGGFD